MNSRGSPTSVESLARSRLELVPVEGVEERADHLPRGTKVALTCLSRGIENSLQFTQRLTRRGLRVVPHVPARLVTDEAHLEEIVRRLDELDVREVFVIGGDTKKPAGPFSSALELLSAMSGLGHNFEHIGIGGYPEGHPAIDDDVLLQALLDKQPFATYIVSQMCFDSKAIIRWVAGLRRQGVRLPVLVGIPGVVDKKRLFQISRKIGVGDSARFLRKHAGLMGQLTANLFRSSGYSPDGLLEELAPYIGDQSYNIVGYHIYTFNQVENTERWRQRMLNLTEKRVKGNKVTQR